MFQKLISSTRICFLQRKQISFQREGRKGQLKICSELICWHVFLYCTVCFIQFFRISSQNFFVCFAGRTILLYMHSRVKNLTFTGNQILITVITFHSLYSCRVFYLRACVIKMKTSWEKHFETVKKRYTYPMVARLNLNLSPQPRWPKGITAVFATHMMVSITLLQFISLTKSPFMKTLLSTRVI